VSLSKDGFAHPLVTLLAPQPDVGVLAAGGQEGPFRIPATIPDTAGVPVQGLNLDKFHDCYRNKKNTDITKASYCPKYVQGYYGLA
jgi:hypothetical protein